MAEMINEKQLDKFCNKYKIKYKVFPQSDTITLDSGIDQWMIKIFHNRDRPYCLYHKNKIRQTNKYHVQRHLTKLGHALDSIINHKKILVNIYNSPKNTYKKNKKINNRRENNYWQSS